MFIVPFPKEGEANGETPQLQNPKSAPKKSTKPPIAPTAITCTCILCLQGRNPITWAVRTLFWTSDIVTDIQVELFHSSNTVKCFVKVSINEILIATCEPDVYLAYLDKQSCHPAVQVYRLENTKPVRKNKNHNEIYIWGLADDWKRLLEHSQSFWNFFSWLVKIYLLY